MLATKARRLKTDCGRSRPCKWTAHRTSSRLGMKACARNSANWRKPSPSLVKLHGVLVNHSPCIQISRAQSLAPPAYRMRHKAVVMSQYGLSCGGTLNTNLLDTRSPWNSNSAHACVRVCVFGCTLALKVYIFLLVWCNILGRFHCIYRMVVVYSIEIDLYLLFVIADSVDLYEMLYHVAFHQGL